MKTFLETYSNIKRRLIREKQNEIISKAKLPYQYTREYNLKNGQSREISDLKVAEDGSLMMEIKGEPYPVKGYMDVMTVNMVAVYKRLFLLILSNLSNQNWFQRIITLLAVRYNARILPDWFARIYSVFQVRLKDEYYSTSVKEIRRVLKGKIDDNLMDAITLVIEYDTHYRYSAQYGLERLNKDNLRKHPIKEIQRILELLAIRDYEEVSVKWRAIRKFASLLVFFPKIKCQIKDILLELDIQKVKLSPEDLHWVKYQTLRE